MNKIHLFKNVMIIPVKKRSSRFIWLLQELCDWRMAALIDDCSLLLPLARGCLSSLHGLNLA